MILGVFAGPVEPLEYEDAPDHFNILILITALIIAFASSLIVYYIAKSIDKKRKNRKDSVSPEQAFYVSLITVLVFTGVIFLLLANSS